MKKISMKGAAWDSVFLTVVKFITIFTAILQTKVLSIGLSLTDYGTYSQANIVVSISVSILLLGLGDAINYFFNDSSGKYSKEQRIQLVNTIYMIELIAGIVLVCIVLFARDLIAQYFSNEALKIVVVIISIKPMLDNMIYFYQILFVSTGKAKVIAIRNLIVSILKVISIFIAVHIFKSVIAIYISLIFLDILQLIFFAFLFSKKEFIISPIQCNFRFVKEIMKYGFPMGIFALTNTLTRDIDKLIIGYMSDTETVAIYSNCSKVLPFDIIVVSFATVLIPYIMKYISQNQLENSILLFKNYLKIGYYTVWTFGAAVLVVTKQAICFLYSSEYLVGEPIFILYVVDSMIKFASMHLILTASGKAKLLMKYSAVSLGANTILNIIFFKIFGTVGPAISTLVVTTVYTVSILNKSTSILKAKWKDIVDIKDVLSFVFGLAMMAAAFYMINKVLLLLKLNQYIAMILVMGGFAIVIVLIYRKRICNILKSINSLKL
ncbi:MAG: oligosaccharide flippase family protein [Clostridiales bacterium]|nr:oligosaccharide flippase family protein [Clostridiales bacterium]